MMTWRQVVTAGLTAAPCPALQSPQGSRPPPAHHACTPCTVLSKMAA